MLAGRKIICVEQNINVEEHRGTNLEISSVTVGVAECSGKCNRYREGEPVDRYRYLYRPQSEDSSFCSLILNWVWCGILVQNTEGVLWKTPRAACRVLELTRLCFWSGPEPSTSPATSQLTGKHSMNLSVFHRWENAELSSQSVSVPTVISDQLILIRWNETWMTWLTLATEEKKIN